MVYLLLSIVFTSSLIVIFKYFERLNINTTHAIVVNYFVASALGFIINKASIGIHEIPNQPWIIVAIILGILFITIFNMVALTAQKMGVSVATVANKMSVIIPVIAAIYLYEEAITSSKVLGILLALTAVYLTSKNDKVERNGKIDWRLVLLPVLVFIGSGIIDVLINYSQVMHLKKNDSDLFLSTAFASAAFIGIFFIGYQVLILRVKPELKSILGGIVLGIPNYLSMYFMLKALDTKIFENSVLFPINNMGIVALSTVCALLLFKEKLSAINWLGILLSILAIAIIAFTNQ